MGRPDPTRTAGRLDTAADPVGHGLVGPHGTAGPLIRRVRQAQGLTLAELGDRCGYSASTMSRLERGHQPLRDIVVLASIAGALGLPVASSAKPTLSRDSVPGRAPGDSSALRSPLSAVRLATGDAVGAAVRS